MESEWKYPSDLSDEQWRIIKRLLPKPARRGRKPIDRRRVIEAVLYVVRSGCQWRMLPRDFPNWSTVYGIFRRWRLAGLWQQIHDALREAVRKSVGKKPTPTAAIIDSQSVRTAEGGEERGYDAGKKWVRETFGWVLETILRPVNVQGFIVLPKRWIVERTFAWISRCRRNARDYERKPEHSEAMIHLTMIALMSKRLAKLKN